MALILLKKKVKVKVSSVLGQQEDVLSADEISSLEQTIKSSIRSAQERQNAQMQVAAAASSPDLAHMHYTALEAESMSLSQQADLLQKAAGIYTAFAEDHPIIAEYGTTAALMGVKTLVAGAAGAASQVLTEIRGRVVAKALNLDLAIESSIKHGAAIFKKIDITLTDEQAHTLSSAYLLSPMVLAGATSDVKFAFSKMGGKLTGLQKTKLETDYNSNPQDFSKNYFKNQGVDHNVTPKFGKTEIDLGSKFTFKDKVIAITGAVEDIHIPVSANPGNSKVIWKGGKNSIYRDESLGFIDNKKIFWSKDIDNHGGVAYKLFKEHPTHFELIANIAPDGKIIKNKHQSKENKKIEKKDLVCKKNER